MAGVDNWSTTPADNAIKGNIDWSEGMAPAKVNDSARQMMADLAKMFLDRSGALTSTGSAGVFALATNTGITQLKAGLRFTFKANVDFAAGSTLNVDSKGGKKLRIVTSSGDRDIVAGEVLAKGFYDAIYDTTANSGAGGWVVTAVSLDDYYNKASADARYMRLGYDNYPTGHQYLANNKRVYGYKTDGITAVHLAGVNTANMAILGDASVACQINTNGTLTHNGSSIWHAGNMGGGSGLNADLLDGLHASWFQKNVADVDYLEVGQNQLAGARYIDLHTDGLASDYNARIIRGSGPDGNLDIVQSGAGNINIIGGTSLTRAGSTIWYAGNDGAGSGLDADLLDGLQAAAFAQLSADNTFTGSQYLTNNKRLYGKLTDGTTNAHLIGVNTTDDVVVGSANAITKLISSGTLYHNGNKVWDANNDGAASGLDADLLDGQHASNFATVADLASYATTASLSSYALLNTVTSSTATTYPIGTLVLATSAAAIANNATATVYYASGGAGYSVGSGAAPLSGTWRSSGSSLVGGTYVHIMRRVA